MLNKDEMITVAKEEFNETGECMDGEVTHAEIMQNDLEDALQLLGESAIDGSLSFNDILEFRRLYEIAVNKRIESEASDIEFENEITRAGL